ncbi:MAG: arsenic-transporting ATPase [Dehalococcoidales bacterium]|jgi:arsenite-transporting ATPase|nr:arsenic-transporting ATPase [Dehalococcoidales bacterium]
MRVILFTGKGGVGKTSIAAATALRSAELGHRTIVLSTDAAHSLSDSFEVSLGNEPQLIVPNLWGQETELFKTMETYWKTIQKYISALLAWRGMDEMAAEEMSAFPGMEELANLLYVIHYQDEEQYDVVIMDCAPTGETMRLLSFPEILRWWMTRMFPIGRKVAILAHPLAKALMNMPFPDSEVFDSVEELYLELDRIHALFTDAEKTSVRLVVNPEKMVIKEAQRTFTYLHLYGYFTDLVICNRLIPDRVKARYFQAWKDSQKRYHQLIEEGFIPVPISDVPLMEREIVGIPMLMVMAKALYGDDDPTAVFFKGRVQDIHKENKHYALTLHLPFSSKEKISVTQVGDELAVQVANFRRNVTLPHTLVGLEVVGAKLENGELRIKFRGGEEPS